MFASIITNNIKMLTCLIVGFLSVMPTINSFSKISLITTEYAPLYNFFFKKDLEKKIQYNDNILIKNSNGIKITNLKISENIQRNNKYRCMEAGTAGSELPTKRADVRAASLRIIGLS